MDKKKYNRWIDLFYGLWIILVITPFEYWTRDFAKSARKKLKARLNLKTLIIEKDNQKQVAPVLWLYWKWYSKVVKDFLNLHGIMRQESTSPGA
jgi:hypothetical protein